jgi:hypothetical protein
VGRSPGAAVQDAEPRLLCHIWPVSRTPSLFLAACLTLFSVVAQAQAPDQSGFSGFPSTRPPGPWSPDANLWLSYAMRSRDQPGSSHALGAIGYAQVGILSRGAIALRVPAVILARDSLVADKRNGGISNIALDGRVRLLGAAAGSNGAVKDGSALALRGIVQFPMGGPAGSSEWSTQFSAITDIEVFGIVAGAELAWQRSYDNDRARQFRDALQLQLGFRLPLRLLTRIYPGRVQEAALLELSVSTLPRDFFEKSSTLAGGRVGYRFMFDDIFSTLTVGTTFTETRATDLQVLLGVGYAPRKHDQDADQVPDSRDQCVHLPEDRDGFQDEDGCADDDNDGDMIVDEDDRCPNVPAEEGHDEDEDGCTDP